MILTRRKLMGGLGLLVAAPAIVRAESLMRIRPIGIEVATNPFWNGVYSRYSGYDVLNISPGDLVSALEYEWTQAAVTIVRSEMLP